VRAKAVQDDSELLKLVKESVLPSTVQSILSDCDVVDNTACFDSIAASPLLRFSSGNTVVTMENVIAPQRSLVLCTPRFFRNSGVVSVDFHVEPGQMLSPLAFGFVRVPIPFLDVARDTFCAEGLWLWFPTESWWSVLGVGCTASG
jgi:hypothetical protein